MTRIKHGSAAWAAVLAGALALTGCASSQGTPSSGGGNNDVSAARKVLGEATAKVTTFDFPAEQVAAPKDKLVVAVPCAYAAEGCKREVDAIAEAAKALGWRYQMIDPAGDPDKMRAAVRTAIQLHADGIFLGSIPSSVVKDDILTARSGGIKVVNMSEPAPDGFADANTLYDHTKAGRWNAAYLTVATKGAGKVISVNDPEFPSVVEWHQGFVDGLKELCPGCRMVKDTNFQIANLQTQVPTDFQATLQANPTANAVWTAYDPVALSLAPVIKRSPQNGKITVVSQNGDPGALQAIKAGDQPFKATIGVSVEWQSYAAVDQMVRLLAGNLPASLKTVNVPEKLISADNVSSIPWDGDLDWKDTYLKLWKTS
ncbi:MULTISPECIES: sugar ABC transporter substrate-binding protein [Arthrobacter]|uniref:Sugar ABC transporter substrate-binding protein n=1 Tax=Arthrobacter terricola TaxID=2547396 RepID=A0A4R5KBB1_9MICC|nr:MULTISPECIES: sugar ABC transporter substrate-binding protein [Arthrobacter]MBT8163170.1 sugar ABC transporter substrate-binding protein [Arthrobacter sp. GN70]TDF91260.1 sugar ABC transporter substrate-binding protein [Arthrobacter terricola]